MRKLDHYLAFLLLIASIAFNLWLYRLEPTAHIDPNDNTFQFALVDRTNQIWDYAQQNCSWPFKPFCGLSLLVDHWVPNWAEGYNLPYYYSHIPQIAVVTTWRFLHVFLPALSLYSYYHIIIYLLLSLFPVSVYLALRVIGLSPLAQGIGALLASQLSTDGLYGLDPPSFLWRGYGLSSQLFAMIWLPLAIAYAYRYLTSAITKKHPISLAIPAIFFLAATTGGHLGLGVMAFLSIGALAIAPCFHAILLSDWKGMISPLGTMGVRLGILLGAVGIILAYWIVPILIHGDYHNISFWDPVWKFDSYGAKEIIIRLFNGDLFDFGRLPVLTYLILAGALIALTGAYAPFAYLFFFWILLYFGRTTWGGLVDLIPGMGEFHLSRFIVGVHLSGLFLLPLALEWIIDRLSRLTKSIPGPFYALASVGILIALVYPQTVRYAAHNDVLIRQANGNYMAHEPDAARLFETLRALQKTNPGRVFAGRGGSWGRAFQIAETPYYMHLSTYGIPTVLWLPETWSPNSDIEQYFSEDQAKDYVLYNIRYVVTPPAQPAQPFWKLLTETATWKLYEVATDGYITTGIRPAIVSTEKKTFVNVVRLWIQSDYHTQGLYPELTFDPTFPKKVGLPNFRMIDEATYTVPAGTSHSLFAEMPVYLPPEGCADGSGISVHSQHMMADMTFRATVDAQSACSESLVILRQTFHPGWNATIDGKPAETMIVFPFYVAVKLETPGVHEVEFAYRPSPLKGILAVSALFGIAVCVVAIRTRRLRQAKE